MNFVYTVAYNSILCLHGALEHSKTTHDTTALTLYPLLVTVQYANEGPRISHRFSPLLLLLLNTKNNNNKYDKIIIKIIIIHLIM